VKSEKWKSKTTTKKRSSKTTTTTTTRRNNNIEQTNTTTNITTHSVPVSVASSPAPSVSPCRLRTDCSATAQWLSAEACAQTYQCQKIEKDANEEKQGPPNQSQNNSNNNKNATQRSGKQPISLPAVPIHGGDLCPRPDEELDAFQLTLNDSQMQRSPTVAIR
jgi:hypothetical protein